MVGLTHRQVAMLLAMFIGGVMLACGPSPAPTPNKAQEARNEIARRQQEVSIYVPKNHVELKNYNNRTEIADDPTTILWCTSFPLTQGVKPFTTPIVGKLTSGAKRPIATSQNVYAYQSSGTYSPELPGPDGMYGTSGEYRYGFTPSGMYADFYDLGTFCTNEPTVWQTQQTVMMMAADPALLAAQKDARTALQAGDAARANSILGAALEGR